MRNTSERDWEHFHFPTRPVGYYSYSNDGNEESNINDTQQTTIPTFIENHSVPAEPFFIEDDIEMVPVESPAWIYDSENSRLAQNHTGYRIELFHYDTSNKIIKFLAIFRDRYSEDSFQSMRAALDKASRDQHGLPLNMVLENHSNGETIRWRKS